MIDGAGAAGSTTSTDKVGGFGDVLRGKLDQLSQSQEVSNQASQDLATGDVDDIAKTMLQIEQANVSLQLATQLRNKAVEAYQEILRMQI